MMCKKILICFGILFSLVFSSKAYVLSEKAKISLITIGPGEDLYSSFGHSAFWVYDPEKGLDKIYNYGTFDFNESNFYIKFIRGKLLYRLSITEMQWLLEGARLENRGVIEQVLDLDQELKEKLFAFLENNYLPQNRAYKYDFFLDNCSTRLRDALKDNSGDRLNFRLKEEGKRSFRQLLDPFLLKKQWQDLGMDIGLGTPADKIATPYDYMYLPEFLMEGFATATLKKGDATVPLVKETNVLYDSKMTGKPKASRAPLIFFWLMFGLTLLYTFYQIKKKRVSHLYDLLLLVFTGFLGLLIVFLWFGTDHYVTRNNWNLIWANPLNLIALFYLLKRKSNAFTKYFLIYGIATALLLICWQFIPQELNYASFPFVLLLSLRSFFIFYRFYKAEDFLVKEKL